MEADRLKKPMAVLTLSFFTQIISMGVLVYLYNPESTDHLEPIDVVCLVALIVSAIFFYISLGLLAKRLGRSWIVWVGLTIITKPIGMFVAYFLMSQKVTEFLAANDELE